MGLYDRDWVREEYKKKEKYNKQNTKYKNFKVVNIQTQDFSIPVPLQIIIGVVCICMVFGGAYISNGKIDSTQIGTSVPGVGHNITELYFNATESAETREYITGFLNAYGIDYKTINYDTEKQAYFVKLKGYKPTTEDNVKMQVDLIQEKITNYCSKNNTNLGVERVGTVHKYTELQ